MAAFNCVSWRMSCGIWLLIDDWTPGFEGLEDLLPTKRLRGLDAPFKFDSPTFTDIVAWRYNVREEILSGAIYNT
jgi:hypothetical protein